MEKKIVNIGKESYKLIFDNFDEEMDIDSLLKIDYSNLIGEMVTFPVIVNRFGNLLAEAESQVSEAKLNLEVFEAKTKEKLRLQLTAENGGKNPTVDALNNAVILNAGFQAMKKRLFESQKTRDYINSIFWSAKDKSSKLDKLSLSIQIGDVSESMIEGRINNVTIKKANNKVIK